MADTLNKTDLVAAIAAASGQSQAAVSGVVDAFFNVVSKSVAIGHQGRDPGLDLVRADPPRRACRPQPRDGRDHPDRREQGRQGLGRQQAEGCCQGLRPHRTARRAPTAWSAPFAASRTAASEGRDRVVPWTRARPGGRPAVVGGSAWSSSCGCSAPRPAAGVAFAALLAALAFGGGAHAPTLDRSRRRRALRLCRSRSSLMNLGVADTHRRPRPRGVRPQLATSPSSAARSTSPPPAPASGPSPAAIAAMLTFSSLSYTPFSLRRQLRPGARPVPHLERDRPRLADDRAARGRDHGALLRGAQPDRARRGRHPVGRRGDPARPAGPRGRARQPRHRDHGDLAAHLGRRASGSAGCSRSCCCDAAARRRSAARARCCRATRPSR